MKNLAVRQYAISGGCGGSSRRTRSRTKKKVLVVAVIVVIVVVLSDNLIRKRFLRPHVQ